MPSACEKSTGRRRRFRASTFVLAAGALGSPHVLLASELERLNPAGHLVGRHLMRHCSAIVSRKRLSHKTRDQAEARFSCFARLPRAYALG